MGAGRKPKPKGEKQRHRITSNFTDAEHRKLVKAAGDGSVGGFIRHLVLKYLARRRK